MLHELSSLSVSTTRQLTEPIAMNTTGLLLKRGETELARRHCWQATLEALSSTVSLLFSWIMKRAQFSRPELTPHSVHHTTVLAQLNIPSKSAQYLTGHAMGRDVHSRVYLYYTPDLPPIKEALGKRGPLGERHLFYLSN